MARRSFTVIVLLLATAFAALAGCANPQSTTSTSQDSTGSGEEGIVAVEPSNETNGSSEEENVPAICETVWVPTQAWYANVMLLSEQSGTITFTYDDSGNLASRNVTLPGISTKYTDTFSYDALGNVEGFTRSMEENGSFTFSNGTVTVVNQAYNDAGLLTSYTEQADEAHSSQTSTHALTYDEQGRIRSERTTLTIGADPFEFVSGFECDDKGWTTARTTTLGGFDPTKHEVAYTYDDNGFLKEYTVKSAAGDTQRFIALTDEIGNVTEIQREDGSTFARFEYEQIEVTTPGAYAISACKDYEYTYCRNVGDSPFNLLSSAYYAI